MTKIIEVNNLVKQFGNFLAVDDVSFSVNEGEIFGFLGPNGAGKSTTIRMLATLSRPTSGKASVGGFDVVKNPEKVRSLIGLVAEKIILYDHLTADENLRFFGKLNHMPGKLIKERSDRRLKSLHMDDWRSHMTGTFSTGMKQRINIIRALLTEPKVLFLDEPTLGLDPQTTRVIRNFLKEEREQGTTIILTTHDMIEAEALSDRVAIIDHGKVAALDTAVNLKKLVKNVDNPTLEDVFLEITGKEIRDIAEGRMKAAPTGRFASKTKNRVR
jgi:ABC-2 type transport system ATP-binding protein